MSLMVPVENLPASSVVEFINEYADAPRAAAGESGKPYPQLEILESCGATLAQSVALANDLYRVFAEPGDASELLNQFADQQHLNHRLASDGRLVWMRLATSDRATAAATAALIDFVGRQRSDRFGMCDADACVDVYIDSSQAKNRSYCSDTCHTRTRVARWRARQRHATSANPGEEN